MLYLRLTLVFDNSTVSAQLISLFTVHDLIM